MSWNKNRNRYREGFPDCLDAFRKLPDPRQSPTTRHYFGEILFIALAATVSGMDGFEDIAVFSREREDWLRSHLELPNGLPSADTYARVFAAIDVSGKNVPAPPQSRAPSLPGFFTVTQGEEPLLTAAVHFADTREADLSACAPTETEPISNSATMELHTAPDPFSRIWVIVLLAALLVAWHFTAWRERAEPVAATR